MTDTVTTLLTAIAAGTGIPSDVFAEDAVLDATVPGWRLRQYGPDAICEQFAGWYADPGAFEELERTPVPGGELVRFLLTWTEYGVPHAAHQTHILELAADGRITKDWMFCGGRWDAGLLAQMEEADRVRA